MVGARVWLPRAIAALGCVMSTAASAQSIPDNVTASADVCVAALLKPDRLADVVATDGFTEKGTLPVTKDHSETSFGNAAGDILQVSDFKFGDSRMKVCFASLPSGLDKSGVETLRGRLSADPAIKMLEGDVVETAPGSPNAVRLAQFKRPGNDPMLFVKVVANSRSTSLTLTSISAGPSKAP